MRIAVVNWTSRHVGGAETYLADVMPALGSLGHDVFFWTEQDGPEDRTTIAGLDAFPRCSAGTIGLSVAVETLASWQPDVLFAHGMLSPAAERRVLDLAPTVFFAHAYYGTCITGSKTVGLPVVQPCERQFGLACLAHFYPKRCGGLNPLAMIADYQRQAARLDTLRRAAGIVTISQHMRREYLQHGFTEAHVTCLPPSMPTGLDGGGAMASVRGRSDRDARDGHRIVFVGRMDRLKGCRTLLDAMTDLRRTITGPITLTIAGDGPDMSRCRTIARAIEATTPDTTIAFAGWLSRHDCARLVDDSDVLAMPSLWPEPFGLAGPEAIARGVPVAAFAVGGIPEWLEDGRTGALASGRPPTPAGLAHAIARCLTEPAIRQTLRNRRVSGPGPSPMARHVSVLLDVLRAAAGAEPARRSPIPSHAASVAL